MGRTKKENKIKPPWFDEDAHIRRKIVRFFIHLFAWIGLAVLFYVGFSFFFDTPVEYRMKMSANQLREEYEALSGRYDTISQVLDNIVERDKVVFEALFEAEPYDFDRSETESRWETYERLLSKNNKVLAAVLASRSHALSDKVDDLERSFDELMDKIEAASNAMNGIPAIQPIVNKDLTLLTASFGMRINPFYKLLAQHNGVDFSVPVGTRVFATADGVVKDVTTRTPSTGLSIIVAHDNGYMTTYSNLDKALVRKNQSVKRGDIIALSGDSGQSLAPHLHYEVARNGMRVDPIHYFFMELSPAEYRKIMRIAESGMQSFD